MNKNIIRRTLGSSAYLILNKQCVRQIGLLASLMLSELIDKDEYWANRLGDKYDSWFFHTVEKIEENIPLGEKAQRTAKRKLIEWGLIDIEKRGLPSKFYFRVNHDKVVEMLNRDVTTSFPEEDASGSSEEATVGSPGDTAIKNPKLSNPKVINPKREEEAILPSSSLTDRILASNYLKVFNLDKLQPSDIKQINNNPDKVELLLSVGFERVLQLFEAAKIEKKKANPTWIPPSGTGISTVLKYPGISRFVFDAIYFEKLEALPELIGKHYFDPDFSQGEGIARSHLSHELESFLYQKNLEPEDFFHKDWEQQYSYCREFRANLAPPTPPTAQKGE